MSLLDQHSPKVYYSPYPDEFIRTLAGRLRAEANTDLDEIHTRWSCLPHPAPGWMGKSSRVENRSR